MKPTDDELEARAARLEGQCNCNIDTSPCGAEDDCRENQKIAAMLRACKGRVRVKPLVWEQARDGAGWHPRLTIAYCPVFEKRFYAEHPEKHAKIDAAREARILAALEPAPDHGEKQAYIEGTQSGWDAALQAVRNACMKLRHSDDLENDDQRVGVLECVLAIGKLKKGPPHD